MHQIYRDVYYKKQSTLDFRGTMTWQTVQQAWPLVQKCINILIKLYRRRMPAL